MKKIYLTLVALLLVSGCNAIGIGNGEPQKTPSQQMETTQNRLKNQKPMVHPKTQRDKNQSIKPPEKVKGIYVSAASAGGDRVQTLIDLLGQKELNAMVIDIKDDSGHSEGSD